MATLVKVTFITRAVLKWGAIVLLGIVILLLLVRVGANLRNKYFPAPPPPPTVAFGKLPELVFPKSKTSKTLSYSIDTITGALPTLPTQVKVYKTVKAQASILALERAREKVGPLGFTLGEKARSPRVYEWNDKEGRTIKFDIVSGDFDVSSNFYNDRIVQEAQKLPSPEAAKEDAKIFLNRLGLLSSDLDIEQAKISFFTISANQIIPTTSLSGAQIIRVGIPQKPQEELPVVSPEPNQSQIYFLIGSNAPNEGGKIVEAHFFHRTPDATNPSTYPIKTGEAAFEELKKGDTYIARVSGQAVNEIAIKNVQLGYYVDPRNQDFFNPVFIFEGTNGFVAYVQANQ